MLTLQFAYQYQYQNSIYKQKYVNIARPNKIVVIDTQQNCNSSRFIYVEGLYSSVTDLCDKFKWALVLLHVFISWQLTQLMKFNILNHKSNIMSELDAVALLITDPSPTSSATLSELFIIKLWYLTCDMWHVMSDMLHVTWKGELNLRSFCLSCSYDF